MGGVLALIIAAVIGSVAAVGGSVLLVGTQSDTAEPVAQPLVVYGSQL